MVNLSFKGVKKAFISAVVSVALSCSLFVPSAFALEYVNSPFHLNLTSSSSERELLNYNGDLLALFFYGTTGYTQYYGNSIVPRYGVFQWLEKIDSSLRTLTSYESGDGGISYYVNDMATRFSTVQTTINTINSRIGEIRNQFNHLFSFSEGDGGIGYYLPRIYEFYAFDRPADIDSFNDYLQYYIGAANGSNQTVIQRIWGVQSAVTSGLSDVVSAIQGISFDDAGIVQAIQGISFDDAGIVQAINRLYFLVQELGGFPEISDYSQVLDFMYSQLNTAVSYLSNIRNTSSNIWVTNRDGFQSVVSAINGISVGTGAGSWQPDVDVNPDASVGLAVDSLVDIAQNAFPFNLPFVLYAVINTAVAAPVTPEIDVDIPIYALGEFNYHVSLSDFDGLAALVRSLFCAAFIAFLTKQSKNWIVEV